MSSGVLSPSAWTSAGHTSAASGGSCTVRSAAGLPSCRRAQHAFLRLQERFVAGIIPLLRWAVSCFSKLLTISEVSLVYYSLRHTCLAVCGRMQVCRWLTVLKQEQLLSWTWEKLFSTYSVFPFLISNLSVASYILTDKISFLSLQICVRGHFYFKSKVDSCIPVSSLSCRQQFLI